MEESLQCAVCWTDLTEPYIECIKCRPKQVFICLHCFARGMQFDGHESNHSYVIVKKDFPLFENNWTAKEDDMLLKAVAECGHGNWKDISQQIQTKTSWECERHYNKYYINDPPHPLPEFPEPDVHMHPNPITFKLSEDPPRPPENSLLFSDMAGYMAARGDFIVEHDNYFEMELNNITQDDDDEELDTRLKFAVLDSYYGCLKERQRRKRIIRDYGLININKLFAINRRFDKTIRGYIENLRVFTRLLEPVEWDLFVESLHFEQELKNDIQKLQSYRRNGLTRLRHIKTFVPLKVRREASKGQRHLLSDLLSHIEDDAACSTWLQRQVVIEKAAKGLPIPLPSAPRRSAPPLDITGLPGYDKLNTRERNLCALVRLIPEAFIEFRDLLVNECKRLGCLKLAQARILVKIDVNKTRKIYDFLVNEGMINKDH
ncbi:transcriptional adapter 2-alpha-like [Gigantopelta aegis]|uniref:transcriptional adapter 2-alpha-like n=1 Tax=Gigantopelta aegis TaxID=1735272 RepID=UPI001B88A9D9|nr:transcriptional adapter 2-alpha-like [Gigantopelta aegis]